jgi:hypothetical protein
MGFVSKVEQFVTLLFRQLAEKYSVQSLQSQLMAVCDLTNTHRLLHCIRNDEVSNTYGCED